MPDSTYDRIRKQECEWCAKGCTFVGPSLRSHWPPKELSYISYTLPCTAPSRDEVIERLAKESEKLRTLCAVAIDISDRDYVAWSDWKDGAIAALKEEPNAR